MDVKIFIYTYWKYFLNLHKKIGSSTRISLHLVGFAFKLLALQHTNDPFIVSVQVFPVVKQYTWPIGNKY